MSKGDKMLMPHVGNAIKLLKLPPSYLHIDIYPNIMKLTDFEKIRFYEELNSLRTTIEERNDYYHQTVLTDKFGVTHNWSFTDIEVLDEFTANDIMNDYVKAYTEKIGTDPDVKTFIRLCDNYKIFKKLIGKVREYQDYLDKPHTPEMYNDLLQCVEHPETTKRYKLAKTESPFNKDVIDLLKWQINRRQPFLSMENLRHLNVCSMS